MKPESKLERSARLWMRAYPRRWRLSFGDDLVAVLHDVTAPGTQRVPMREAAEIVRAGWALRWREHPPFWRSAGYRVLGIRLPDEYRFWVMDDLLGPLHGFRSQTVAFLLLIFSVGLGWPLTGPNAAPYTAPIASGSLIFIAIVTVAFGSYRARQDWQKFISPHVPLELLPRRERRRLARN